MDVALFNCFEDFCIKNNLNPHRYMLDVKLIRDTYKINIRDRKEHNNHVFFLYINKLLTPADFMHAYRQELTKWLHEDYVLYGIFVDQYNLG